MKKDTDILLYILFCVFLCASIAIAALYSDLSQADIEISQLANIVSQFEQTINEQNNIVSEKKQDLVDIQKDLDDTKQIFFSLQEDYYAKEIEIKKQRLLLSQAEKLKEDDGNQFNETQVFNKIVYLTFDDGPSVRTLEILDILDKYSIKATFFVVFHRSAEENSIYKEIVERGHSIGTTTHIRVKIGISF